MNRKPDPAGPREIIFEFQSVGDIVRVAAVDVATGEEVVIQGPAATPQSDLERIAARKLQRRLEQRETGKDEKKTPPRGGGGVIV